MKTNEAAKAPADESVSFTLRLKKDLDRELEDARKQAEEVLMVPLSRNAFIERIIRLYLEGTDPVQDNGGLKGGI